MDYIEIGGKKRPFIYGWHAIEKFAEHKGAKQLSEITGIFNIDIKDAPQLFYYALENGCISEGKDIDFSQEDVKKWLDMKLIVAGLTILTKSISGKN